MAEESKVEELVPTKGRTRRQRRSFVVRISQTLVVRIQIMDMMTMIMNNLVPMHLLDAAQKFEEMERKMVQAAKDGSSAVNVAKEVDSKALEETMKFLRHYATVVVLEPKIVAVDDGVEDHIPVDFLTAEELMGIFYARGPNAEEEVESLLTKEEATEFRGPTSIPSPQPGPDGKAVRPTPKLVDRGEREVINA